MKRYSTLFVFLFLGSIFGAYIINTNGLAIETRYVSIDTDSYSIQGLLYTPKGTTSKLPAVVLAHGITNAKETVSGYALEIAKHGMFALTIDETGHGNSGGKLTVDRASRLEPTLGLKFAISWLKKQPLVDQNKIGVLGHSMGGASAKEVSLIDSSIKSTILIGGGVFDMMEGEGTPMNASSPNNLLMVIGRFDVLFDLPTLQSSSHLKAVFNTTTSIKEGSIYGSFSSLTARKLVVSQNTHLLEIIDPNVSRVIIQWLEKSFSLNFYDNYQLDTYLYRDSFLIIAFFSLLPITNYLVAYINKKYGPTNTRTESEKVDSPFSLVSVSVVYGLISLVLFMPSQILGNMINFPPMAFGSGFAFWLAGTGLITFLLILFRKGYLKSEFRKIKDSFTPHSVVFSLLVFFFLYLLTISIEFIFQINFTIIVPLFNEIGNEIRILMFFLMLPFAFVYFLVENSLFFSFTDLEEKSRRIGLFKLLIAKVTPFVLMLLLFYLPILLFSTVIIPGLVGFFFEFLNPIIPLFVFTTSVNWLFYRETNEIWSATLTNSLLISWVMASLFPLV